MTITSTDVLIVIDVQNDFCPGGALAVARGDEVIDADPARCAEHSSTSFSRRTGIRSITASFASTHPGEEAI